MAATSILSTDEEMNAMAGENVDATGWIDANKTAWGLQAENYLNILCRHNLSDNFATLNIGVKYILSEYVARYVAICGICYNMAGYINLAGDSDRIQAENMINVHVFRIKQIERLLIDQKSITFIKGA